MADDDYQPSVVVAVTEAARVEMLGRYPDEDPKKFRFIPNGYDTMPAAAKPAAMESPEAHIKHSDKVVLTFLGSVYKSTDPGTLVEAVLGLPPELRSRLHLRFIGHIETDTLRDSLARLGDTIELKGFVPQAEALRSIADTDYLLLISHDRINVSAKLYDYLGGGKPIFAAIHPQGEIRQILEETRAGRWADSSDPASIRALLASLLDPAANAAASQLQPDQERIASYHRRAITQRYSALLREAVAEAKTNR